MLSVGCAALHFLLDTLTFVFGTLAQMLPGVTLVHGCESCDLDICRDCADGVPREVLMSSVTGTLAFDVQVEAPSVLQVCPCMALVQDRVPVAVAVAVAVVCVC